VTELEIVRAGLVPYEQAWEMQRELHARRVAGEAPDTLLLLEHPSVYTAGKRTEPHERPIDGTPVIDVDRGGKITWHGPGQLVGYPIVGVDDVVAYVRQLEQAIVAALAKEGVTARGRPEDGPDYTGVWVQERKIASIGVHVTRGVTTHGYAVNVQNDLQPFEWIVPCGIENVRMTSLYLATGVNGGMDCFRKRVAFRFAEAFGLRQRVVTLERLLGSPAPVESIPA
jgi:lipoyl(octanoyl) transferase